MTQCGDASSRRKLHGQHLCTISLALGIKRKVKLVEQLVQTILLGENCLHKQAKVDKQVKLCKGTSINMLHLNNHRTSFCSVASSTVCEINVSAVTSDTQ